MVSGRQLVRDLIGSHQSLLNLIFAVSPLTLITQLKGVRATMVGSISG